MSYFGSITIREIERGEREIVHWQKYAGRLTPDERKRIARGNYEALRRPLEPTIIKGDLLEVTPRLTIRIANVELKHGRWRCRIDKVYDDRSSGGHWRRLRDPALANGDVQRVDPLTGQSWYVNPPEPERVDGEWLERFRQDAERVRGLSVTAAIMEKP